MIGEGLGIMAGVGLKNPGFNEMLGIFVMMGLPKSEGLRPGGGIP